MNIMECTSAEAAKLLRKLNEEKYQLESMEEKKSLFNAALGEDVESVRPEYNYAEFQEKLNSVEEKIRIVKHAINLFNVSQVVPGFDITIDQMLVFIPQLSARKRKLSEMSIRLPKQRTSMSGYGGNSSVIDYCYANYNIEQVEKDFQDISNLLAKAQTELDILNNTKKMEINIEL